MAVGALPKKVDLSIYQGDDFFMTVWVRDDTGELVDLTGYSVRSEIRGRSDAATTLATFTTTISAAGRVDVRLPSSVTATLTPGTAVWDLELTDPATGGRVMTPCAGNVSITAGVTR